MPVACDLDAKMEIRTKTKPALEQG